MEARRLGHHYLGPEHLLVGLLGEGDNLVARVLVANGLDLDTVRVDALDERAVDAHADAVAAQGGSIDIGMNVITHGDLQGTPFIEMDVEDYLRPVETAVRTTFLTSRAAGRHMVRQGSGVLLAFGGHGDPLRDYYLNGLQVASRPSSPCAASSPPSWTGMACGS
jgi:NAD(P)-dependent dehydrogenase (short-subunit alcohol dehydrogenase family)